MPFPRWIPDPHPPTHAPHREARPIETNPESSAPGAAVAPDRVATDHAPPVDRLLFAFTGGFIVLFCLLALISPEALASLVDTGFAWAARYFGLYWQLLLLATFGIGILMAMLRGSGTPIGGLEAPEFSLFQWGSMIMCTLLAGGGVFWAAGEPLAHFLSVPPAYDGEIAARTAEAVPYALAQSYLHWGFLAWAILGSLTTTQLMHYHYEEGLPLAPRTLLYPVLGRHAIDRWPGDVIDAACVIAVVAGTVGPIGFLGLQVSYGLETLFGIPDTFTTQAAVIGALVLVYLTSAVSGIDRGIQILSRANMLLGGGLLVFILVFGPSLFIASSYLQGLGTHLQQFFGMALYRGDAELFGPAGWLGSWTVFFWGWFIGYGPLMAIFIARISRGRSIRAIVLMLSVGAPLITMAWFTIIGGAGLGIELQDPGRISSAMDGFDLPAALMAITGALPLGFVVSLLFLVLTTVFVATTGDSMTYSLSVTLSRSNEPSTIVRVFWGLAMGAMAVVLISVGSGGIGKLQNFIVITAVPVSLILLPSLWDAPRIAWRRGAAPRADTEAAAAS